MINLYVGDSSADLAESAKKNHPDAQLVDHSNYHFFLSDQFKAGAIYTSLADLPKIDNRNILYELLVKATDIFYCPPNNWSDHSENFSWESQKILTEYLLFNIHRQRNVVGLDKVANTDSMYLTLVDQRPSQKPCLWISGCSISHGVGVSLQQRYGNIVANQLKIDAGFLTKSGSGLEVQCDQILRSDIRAGDIVIWGLTSELRAPKFDKFLISETDLDQITSQTRLYKAITSVHQVINFCQKVSAELILLPLICTEHLRLMLINNPCYHDLPYQSQFFDAGTDGIHPGPIQHQYWADYCINFLTSSRKAKA